jgi:hypothetical protein
MKAVRPLFKQGISCVAQKKLMSEESTYPLRYPNRPDCFGHFIQFLFGCMIDRPIVFSVRVMQKFLTSFYNIKSNSNFH